MILTEANLIATRIVNDIQQHCKTVLVAGSIRRGCPEINDIDLVLIPVDMERIKTLCLNFHPSEIFADEEVEKPRWGKAIARFNYKGKIGVDMYFANDQTLATLFLIRTGSAEHNKFLCGRAKQRKQYLAADGSGIFADRKKEQSLPSTTETEIFDHLGMPFIEPHHREIVEGKPAWETAGVSV